MIRLPLSNAQENMEKKSLMFFPPPSSSLAFEDLSTQDQNMANCTSLYQPTSDISTGFDVPVDSSITTSNLHTPSQLSESEGKSSKKVKAAERKMKKPRYAFQTRSHVDILDDGYRWRKYGQKAVKNNKFPRSYYRCTYQGCTVKKQVQRLSMDEGVVVTTYEGMHTHTIEKSTDNFEHILSQMQIYSPNF